MRGDVTKLFLICDMSTPWPAISTRTVATAWCCIIADNVLYYSINHIARASEVVTWIVDINTILITLVDLYHQKAHLSLKLYHQCRIAGDEETKPHISHAVRYSNCQNACHVHLVHRVLSIGFCAACQSKISTVPQLTRDGDFMLLWVQYVQELVWVRDLRIWNLTEHIHVWSSISLSTQ